MRPAPAARAAIRHRRQVRRPAPAGVRWHVPGLPGPPEISGAGDRAEGRLPGPVRHRLRGSAAQRGLPRRPRAASAHRVRGRPRRGRGRHPVPGDGTAARGIAGRDAVPFGADGLCAGAAHPDPGLRGAFEGARNGARLPRPEAIEHLPGREPGGGGLRQVAGFRDLRAGAQVALPAVRRDVDRNHGDAPVHEPRTDPGAAGRSPLGPVFPGVDRPRDADRQGGVPGAPIRSSTPSNRFRFPWPSPGPRGASLGGWTTSCCG